MVKNHEVNLECSHVDQDWKYNQTGDASAPMFGLIALHELS